MKQNYKLFLIDAYALIYRSYYAFIQNPRITSKGFNTSAIVGFVNTLEEILSKENPEYIAIAFDPAGPTFRHEEYKEYKAQREATPEDIRSAVPYIKDIIRAYNIPILEILGYEADDVIGTIANKAEQVGGYNTFMLTPDKDYAQLVNKHTFMYRPKHNGGYEVLGIKQVLDKYDIKDTRQIIDLLGLMGDSADNIPGCPGVGPKTAQKLIKEFESIEGILENTDKIKGKLREKIEANRKEITFSKYLATIKTDVPIEFKPEELRRERANQKELFKIFEELEFKTLAKRVQKRENENYGTTVTDSDNSGMNDLFNAPLSEKRIENSDNNKEEEKISQPFSITNVKFDSYLSDKQNIDSEDVESAKKGRKIAIELITDNSEPMLANILGVAIATSEEKSIYYPIPQGQLFASEIIDDLRRIAEDEDIEIISHDIKYLMVVLKNNNIDIKGKFFDTMIAHYLVQPELKHNIEYLAEIYTGYKMTELDSILEKEGKGKKKRKIEQLSNEDILIYATERANLIFRLKDILEKELQEKDVIHLFDNIELPLIPVLADMEYNGVKIDVKALKETSESMTARINDIENNIYKEAGIEFNISSPKQVGEVLFDTLKLSEKPKKTKTGQYVTSEDVLESLRSKHNVVGLILNYRSLKKLLSTYIDALPKLINTRTGHIHTTFNQAVTATGRLSSSNPNLQNIPIREEEGREIRRAFIANNSNSEFFSADYSQIELRIMAHLSGDENMIEAFQNGDDIHTATAAKIYGIPLNEVSNDMRRKAKTANFGIIYGISVFGLAERLSISRAEAKELIDGYFSTYPKVKEYMDKSIEVAKEKGYVETVFHRKRYLPDINSKNAVVRGFAERNAINAPIQGSAADIIKVAMINIHKRLIEEKVSAKMIIQVHDELNFSVPKTEAERVEKIVVEEMEKALKMNVPLIADSGKGKNWLEAH